jgi:5-methylcytosine-specific restriction endonuclease McrA
MNIFIYLLYMKECIVCKTPTTRKFCSTKCKSKMYNSGPSQKERAFQRKKEVVLKMGGKCQICGYDKNLASLTFHHLDPANKQFQLDSRKFANCKLDEEVSKCMLVCRNCHGEIEHSYFNNWRQFSNFKELIGSSPTI